MPNQDQIRDLGWWVIQGEDLMAMLHRVHNGESPWLVYMEFYLNSSHEEVDGA